MSRKRLGDVSKRSQKFQFACDVESSTVNSSGSASSSVQLWLRVYLDQRVKAKRSVTRAFLHFWGGKELNCKRRKLQTAKKTPKRSGEVRASGSNISWCNHLMNFLFYVFFVVRCLRTVACSCLSDKIRLRLEKGKKSLKNFGSNNKSLALVYLNLN